MKHQVVAATVAAMVMYGLAAPGATLLMHYDVNNPLSWNGSQLVDLMGFGANLTPGAGNPRTQSNPNTVPADFGTPVFVSSGAALPESATPKKSLDRAYLSFQLFGVLTGSNKHQTIFNTGLPGNANVGGYTMEGIFFLATGYTATENTGIGFTQSSAGENQLIRVPRGTNTSLWSNSSVDNAAGGSQALEQFDSNINGIIPRDEWFHFVKVHDPVADQIRFYINGLLQPALTVAFDPDSSALEYHAFADSYGNVGIAGREIRGIGYSMTRFYRGALSDAEIYANFLATSNIPEPTTLTLLALAGGLAWRRRR